MARYFYSDEGKTRGPVSPNELMSLILDDVLDMDSFVMESRSPQWRKIRDIPELNRFIRESDVRLLDWAEERDLTGLPDPEIPLFFNIPISRLVWMSLLSFGLYEIYWIRANWRFLRFNRKNSTSSYFWRVGLNPVALVGIFQQIGSDKELETDSGQGDLVLNGWFWLLSLAILLARHIAILALRPALGLDILLTLTALFFSILCLVPVQKRINIANEKADKGFSPKGLGHYLSIFLGLFVWLVVLSGWLPGLIRLF
ncbi:MAG: DUF4339 domain-containing protein [Candidatus Cloacimonadaceae bacterium]|jgi:hypothetical protein|nr:DUF4339 domain-containing protein [Candidatus Cloacimonadota bacterium]MDX9949356.1 DUF4339 domain-containing protein [Candidatus Syntrophosphaera sp.]NLN85752.1 DUF4339 domain-containing protein [Candidatus Cloacimonadota bacterium]